MDNNMLYTIASTPQKFAQNHGSTNTFIKEYADLPQKCKLMARQGMAPYTSLNIKFMGLKW